MAVAEIIGLIDRMVAVIDDENRSLARGLPAPPVSASVRKHEIADQFETWVKCVRSRQVCISLADRTLRASLLHRTKRLRIAMAENVARLQAAMEASRRRIDAVMRAIRDDMAASSPYGSNGRIRNVPAGKPFGGAGRHI